MRTVAPAWQLIWRCAPASALLLVARHSPPATGLLVGVASGAGFAVLGTMGNAFVTLIASKGDLGVVEGILLLRGFA